MREKESTLHLVEGKGNIVSGGGGINYAQPKINVNISGEFDGIRLIRWIKRLLHHLDIACRISGSLSTTIAFISLAIFMAIFSVSSCVIPGVFSSCLRKYQVHDPVIFPYVKPRRKSDMLSY